MSIRLLIALALLVPATARADDKVPPACAVVGTPPASAKIQPPAPAARIALAMCEAEGKFNALHLTPDDAGIAAITDAAAPSFAMLDAEVQRDDPFWSPIAQRARAALHVAMAVRMRNSVPPITATTSTAELNQHDQAHTALEPKLKQWLESR
jgi:hypothetical protein